MSLISDPELLIIAEIVETRTRKVWMSFNLVCVQVERNLLKSVFL